MRRRGFLSGLAGAALCPLCARSARADFSDDQGGWSYDPGPTGPAHWSELKPSYAVCGTGAQQSPIDISATIPVNGTPFTYDWPNGAGSVANTGHAIQVNVGAGNTLQMGLLDGSTFAMVQYHFHGPSEHTVNGKSEAMEVHFVHYNKPEEAYAVVGVLLVGGRDDPGNALTTIANVAPPRPTDPPVPVSNLPLATLLPRAGADPTSRPSYYYAGSLTTPPCDQTVYWFVCQQTATVPQTAIDRMKTFYPMNARPLQPLYRRVILKM